MSNPPDNERLPRLHATEVDAFLAGEATDRALAAFRGLDMERAALVALRMASIICRAPPVASDAEDPMAVGAARDIARAMVKAGADAAAAWIKSQTAGES